MRRAVLLFLGAALIVALLEIGLRACLGLGHPLLMMSHPRIEYLARPNQVVRRFGRRAFYNEHSMRSTDLSPRKKDPAEYRVLFLGDSIINGGSTLDQDELATQEVAFALEREWRRPVVTMNVSAGSWGPQNQLAYVREYGFFDCDAAVIVWSIHDLDDVPTFAPLSQSTHPTQNPASALSELLFRYALPYANSALKPVASEMPKPAISRRRAVESMKALLTLLHSHRIRTLVLLHLTRPELARWPAAEISVVEQLAAETNADFRTLGQDFRRALDRGEIPYLRGDPIHTNALGQRLIAERVLAWLRINASP